MFLAQGIADEIPGFFEKKGPGVGDHAAGVYVRSIRRLAEETFGTDYSKKIVCEEAGFRFDFFFPDEATVVEFAFGLHNPISEFERDVCNCLLAIEDGRTVRRLLLVGKPGAIPRLSAPGPRAIVGFAKKHFDLTIEVFELRLDSSEIWNRTML